MADARFPQVANSVMDARRSFGPATGQFGPSVGAGEADGSDTPFGTNPFSGLLGITEDECADDYAKGRAAWNAIAMGQ